MISNFLGAPERVERASSIISTSELMLNEGINPQKSMNFRDKGYQTSVFLVLPRDDGYKDAWHEKEHIYVYEGHDSTTSENGKSVDQLMMYSDGRATDNGKFYKAADNFKYGVRKTPLPVHVYEKLDPGVWFDKGLFELVDATHSAEHGRKVFKFYLRPIDEPTPHDTALTDERWLSAALKAEAWLRSHGRCETCTSEQGLHFVRANTTSKTRGHADHPSIHLRCATHCNRKERGLLA